MKARICSIVTSALCAALMIAMAFMAVACNGSAVDMGGNTGDNDSNYIDNVTSDAPSVPNYAAADKDTTVYEGVNYASNSYYKLAYRTKEEVGDDIIEKVATLLVLSFVETFGYGNGFEGHKFETYYDSIRYNTKKMSGKYFAQPGRAWIWKLGAEEGAPFSFGIHGQFSSFPLSDYKNEQNIAEYKAAYTNYYTWVMQVVLYEMLLGRDDWQSSVNVSGNLDNDGFPKLRYRNNKVVVKDGVPQYHIWGQYNVGTIPTLRRAYHDRVTYYGFTDSDCTKLKSYILDNVIGSIAMAGNKSNNKCYEEYVNTLVDNLIYSEGPDGNPSDTYCCPRISYIDAPLTLSKTDRIFSEIKAQEYQSIVLMTDKTYALESCWIAFECKYPMTISAYYRYYNGKTVRTSSTHVFNLSSGRFDMGMNFNGTIGFSPDFNCALTPFNNVFPANKVTANSVKTRTYKAVSASNNVGMIGVYNEELAQSPFVEIVLSVNRESNPVYGKSYSFKVAIFDIVWKGQ